jgi:hypothetical protein
MFEGWRVGVIGDGGGVGIDPILRSNCLIGRVERRPRSPLPGPRSPLRGGEPRQLRVRRPRFIAYVRVGRRRARHRGHIGRWAGDPKRFLARNADVVTPSQWGGGLGADVVSGMRRAPPSTEICGHTRSSRTIIRNGWPSPGREHEVCRHSRSQGSPFGWLGPPRMATQPSSPTMASRAP